MRRPQEPGLGRVRAAELSRIEVEDDPGFRMEEYVTPEDIELMLRFEPSRADVHSQPAYSIEHVFNHHLLTGERVGDRVPSVELDDIFDNIAEESPVIVLGRLEELAICDLFHPGSISADERERIWSSAHPKYLEMLGHKGSVSMGPVYNEAPNMGLRLRMLAPEKGPIELSDEDYKYYVRFVVSRYNRLGVTAVQETIVALRVLNPEKPLRKDLEEAGLPLSDIQDQFVVWMRMLRESEMHDNGDFHDAAYTSAYIASMLHVLYADTVDVSLRDGLRFTREPLGQQMEGLPPRNVV